MHLQTSNIEITGSTLNDIRLISCIAVCSMLAIALIGTEWESKVSSRSPGFRVKEISIICPLVFRRKSYFLWC